MANTFSTSQIIDEVKKVKLLSYKGFSLSNRVAKKMDKVEVRGCLKSIIANKTTSKTNSLTSFPDKKVRVSQPLLLGVRLPLGKQTEEWQLGFWYTLGLFKHPLTEIDRMKRVGICTI
ncbi:hypothetical protein [Nostoc sp. LPT]|uniref:hypothetical protein n=1 Tax=Nostoc sp. LPT TaxID=2815387 RepID=UPI001DF473D7|nr:hypothetical protein [Nostoc sp. LPT]MBN4005085.1 hypothetical protein [Nostoc sp. LPT]